MALTTRATRLVLEGRAIEQQTRRKFLSAPRNAVQRSYLSSSPLPLCNSSRSFAAAARLHDDRRASSSDNSHNAQHKTGSNPELPAFSLEGLGISRNMKLLLVGILGVFGTMETWMYCKWIWRWWKGEGSEQTSQGAAS